MEKSVLVPLANGFEEIEAISIVDVLRRAGARVVLASVSGREIVTSDRGVQIRSEISLQEVQDCVYCAVDSFDMIALPGGYKGAMCLAKDRLPQEVLKEFHQKGKFVTAICAAPYALYCAGILENVQFTCYPGIESMIKAGHYTEDKNVVVDGKIITSRAPATALAFALTLVEQLFDLQKAKEIANGMLKSCC